LETDLLSQDHVHVQILHQLQRQVLYDRHECKAISIAQVKAVIELARGRMSASQDPVGLEQQERPQQYPTLEQKFWFLFHAKSAPAFCSSQLPKRPMPTAAWLPYELLHGDCVHGQEMARQFHQYARQQLIDSSHLYIDEEGDLIVKVPTTRTAIAGGGVNSSDTMSGQAVMVGVWTAVKRPRL
jgi:hypothetical protein